MNKALIMALALGIPIPSQGPYRPESSLPYVPYNPKHDEERIQAAQAKRNRKAAKKLASKKS